MTPRTKHQQRAGYTLVELVVAIVASSMLIVGLASSIFIATQIVDPGKRTQQILDASETIRIIDDELRYANDIVDRSSTAIEFIVHDRTGDGQMDRIRYEWSGSSGDPLTKTMNGSTQAIIVPSVEFLNFNYTLETSTEQFTSPPTESAELILTEYVGSGLLSSYRVTGSNWIGQYTNPALFTNNSLPADTISWTVTKAEVEAKYTKAGDKAQSWVRLRRATGDNKPSTSVIDEAVLSASSSSGTFAWKTLTFAEQVSLDPNDGICLTVEHKTKGNAVDIQYDEHGDNWRVATNNAGATWHHPPPGDSLRHRIYGKYTQPATTVETVNRKYLKAISTTLQIGDANTRIVAEANLLNRPELCSAVWETRFDVDPTTEDRRVDGTGDWRTRDASDFDVTSLVNGVFVAYGEELDTAPNHNFDKTTTVNVRLRNTSMGGQGALFGINADWSGSTAVPIFAALQLQSDATQTLKVFWNKSNSISQEVAVVPGLSADFVEIRIVIEPTSDLFAVWANDQFVGSFDYTPFDTDDDHRWATLTESGSDAEFDFVRIKVAE